MQKLKIIGKPLLGEKYVEGKKEEIRRRKNNAKFSGPYVRPRTHNVRARALRSHQFFDCFKPLTFGKKCDHETCHCAITNSLTEQLNYKKFPKNAKCQSIVQKNWYAG